MSKQSSLIEWQVVENDADWECLCTPSPLDFLPGVAPTVHNRRDVKRYLGRLAALLLVLASAGTWDGRVTQPGWQPAAANLTATMQQPLKAVAPDLDPLAGRATDNPPDADGWPGYAGAEPDWRAAFQTLEPTSPLSTALYTVDVQGDQKVTRVVRYTDQGASVHRRTRFYRRTASGWQPTVPDATRWGPERSLENTFFVLHFRQNDAASVLAAAPQLDALYTTLSRNFGLALTPAEKLVIEVSVTQPPGRDPSWLHVPDRLIVPSPAVYWAPAELSDTELLAQSLALPLLAQVLAQADEQYHIGLTWQPLMDGLYLWQVWELDLPLAVWREEIVHWLYVDLPAAPGATVVVPKRYQALCDAHKLWMSSPVQIEIPLLCLEWYWEKLFFTSWRPREPFTRLDQLAVRADQSDQRENSYPRGQSVALATLIEYTVAAYGRERLPALMAGLGQYQSWETLLPAVYSVSVTEFEAGWQSYLADRYGVSSFPLE
jgi:hypothetical protein